MLNLFTLLLHFLAVLSQIIFCFTNRPIRHFNIFLCLLYHFAFSKLRLHFLFIYLFIFFFFSVIVFKIFFFSQLLSKIWLNVEKGRMFLYFFCVTILFLHIKICRCNINFDNLTNVYSCCNTFVSPKESMLISPNINEFARKYMVTLFFFFIFFLYLVFLMHVSFGE